MGMSAGISEGVSNQIALIDRLEFNAACDVP